MSDEKYLPNYKPDHLYLHPAPAGVYATLVADNETLIGEVEVSDRCRVAVVAFYVDVQKDFSSFKLVKLTRHKTYGWRPDSEMRLSRFEAAKIADFATLMSGLSLSESKKTRISLAEVRPEALSMLMRSIGFKEILKRLSESSDLTEDVYAVGQKREALAQFETFLDGDCSEVEWQEFFEANTWIFGHGLQYIFLDRVTDKLETTTTGASFDRSGKRVDALMRTRAEVSQFVLVEIKRANTALLQPREYRSGCWSISDELASALTQVQKTTFDFARDRYRERINDSFGNDLGEEIFSIEPRSYLVIGNLKQLIGNVNKVTSFELFRKNIKAPEVITFDELFYRARCIVANVSKRRSG